MRAGAGVARSGEPRSRLYQGAWHSRCPSARRRRPYSESGRTPPAIRILSTTLTRDIRDSRDVALVPVADSWSIADRSRRSSYPRRVDLRVVASVADVADEVAGPGVMQVLALVPLEVGSSPTSRTSVGLIPRPAEPLGSGRRGPGACQTGPSRAPPRSCGGGRGWSRWAAPWRRRRWS